jgi:hypothetical protein
MLFKGSTSVDPTHQEDEMEVDNETQNKENTNVISLFGLRKDKNIDKDLKTKEESSSSDLFAKTMKKNAENAQRLKESRSKANRGVLRSYKIKK